MITKDPEVNARKHLQWLPKDWGAGRIKDFVAQTKNNDPAKRPEETFRYVDISSVSSSSYSNINFQEMKGKDAPSRAKKEVRTNDVLYSTVRPYLKRVAIVPIELNNQVCSTGFCVLRGMPKKLNHNFLYNTLLTHWMTNRISRLQTGSNYPAVNDSDILTQYLPLPPLSEQEKIAEILGKWDEGIENTEKLIDEKKKLKKALMQQLLTGKKRFKEFKGQEWKEVRLDKLGKCIRGVSYKPDKDLKQQEDKTTVRLLRSTNIQESRVVREDMQYVVEGKCKKTQYAKQNDILICMSNGSKPLVGKTAYFDVIDDHRYTVGAFCAIYRTNSGNNSDYINHLFNSERCRRQLWVLLAGTNISNLKNSDIENLKFLVPENPKEQQKIASVLNAADKEIDLLKDKLEALKHQKKGLMQKLLTGKVRVKV
jgi:type I restriction enzyme S subunit